MKTLCQLFVVAVLLATPFSATSAQNAMPGTEYWFAIPPNEYDGYGNARQLEVYVTSRFDTEVTLNVPGLGLSYTKAVKANTITTFTTSDGTMNWGMESRESEQKMSKGIQLIADRPFTAHMISARTYTSEGCQLLPVSQLGTEYRHVSYYDYYEGNQTTARGGGFVIVATEDATVVTIDLIGAGSGSTKAGRSIGDNIVVHLNKGETYMLRGSGLNNQFDITGSHVQADKPIGCHRRWNNMGGSLV